MLKFIKGFVFGAGTAFIIMFIVRIFGFVKKLGKLFF